MFSNDLTLEESIFQRVCAASETILFPILVLPLETTS